MTPKERILITNSNQKPDKLPIFVAAMNEFICQYYDISIDSYLSDSDVCAKYCIKFLKEFDIDSSIVAPGYILYGAGPEIGAVWEFTDGAFPGFRRGIIETEQDIKKINIPTQPSGYFKHYIDVMAKMNDVLGEDYSMVANILGPFSTACFLRGIENALLDTLSNIDLFKKYMSVCTELSVYFGNHVASTGVDRLMLNEIFLTPAMLRPDSFHKLIAPYDVEVQKLINTEKPVPNTMGAFMGLPGDIKSQKSGVSLYHAFFGTSGSLEALKNAAGTILPGFSFPLSISGEALSSQSIDQILDYLKEALDFFILEKGVYPTINLISICAGSLDEANTLATKVRAVVQFRDEYKL